MPYVVRRYRCLRPVLLFGRILSTGEWVRLPPADAAEYVESGHLVEIAEAVLVNGDDRKWTQPTLR